MRVAGGGLQRAKKRKDGTTRPPGGGGDDGQTPSGGSEGGTYVWRDGRERPRFCDGHPSRRAASRRAAKLGWVPSGSHANPNRGSSAHPIVLGYRKRRRDSLDFGERKARGGVQCQKR
mmetsp:Transcript_45218/g.96208  ORF Transcript_45218/g.96208 Transcript_45218/m.96208 type:complete len:118 (+) Transcript_45218:595-948(+)